MLTAFIFTWALSFLLTIIGLDSIPKATFIASRFFIATIFLLALIGSSRLSQREFIKNIRSLMVDRSSLINFLSASFAGVTLAQLFQVIERYSYAPPASDVCFLLNTAPIFIFIFSFFLLYEKINFGEIVGASASLLGMICIVANWERPSTFSPFTRFSNLEIWILLAAILWAIFTVMGKRIIAKYDPLTATTVTIVLGTIPLIPFALYREGTAFLRIPTGGWMLILILGVVCSAISYLLWYQALSLVEASKVGSFLFITPVFLTFLIEIEKRIGLWGICPMVMTPVIVGSILVLVGVFIIWLG
ncbi:MAG: DMT family transporter [Actinomycetota bacterium]|nr:DMT family transporter [Actinomycetota bacterium]